MTVQEIQKLQVGNLIMIGDRIAVVDRISRIWPIAIGRTVIKYEGSYPGFIDIPNCGWCATDCPELNEKRHYTPLEDFHGIPIPENFEKINGVNLWNVPKVVESYQFVHLYQNEWNRYEEFKYDWKLK